MKPLFPGVAILFAVTTLVAVWLFYRASKNSKGVLAFLIGWCVLQAVIGLSGFYRNTTVLPPRFMFLLAPGVALIVLLLTTRIGRSFLDRFDLPSLTILHIVRIPVEIGLFQLAAVHLIPSLMTFEGRNFDILSGITAPFVYYFAFVTHRLSPKFLVVWNLLCLALLLNVLTIAILSVPTPFQQLAFDQPNIAVMQFPYVWLPSVIVPLVLLSHAATLRLLLRRQRVTAAGL